MVSIPDMLGSLYNIVAGGIDSIVTYVPYIFKIFLVLIPNIWLIIILGEMFIIVKSFDQRGFIDGFLAVIEDNKKMLMFFYHLIMSFYDLIIKILQAIVTAIPF